MEIPCEIDANLLSRVIIFGLETTFPQPLTLKRTQPKVQSSRYYNRPGVIPTTPPPAEDAPTPPDAGGLRAKEPPPHRIHCMNSGSNNLSGFHVQHQPHNQRPLNSGSLAKFVFAVTILASIIICFVGSSKPITSFTASSTLFCISFGIMVFVLFINNGSAPVRHNALQLGRDIGCRCIADRYDLGHHIFKLFHSLL